MYPPIEEDAHFYLRFGSDEEHEIIEVHGDYSEWQEPGFFKKEIWVNNYAEKERLSMYGALFVVSFKWHESMVAESQVAWIDFNITYDDKDYKDFRKLCFWNGEPNGYTWLYKTWNHFPVCRKERDNCSSSSECPSSSYTCTHRNWWGNPNLRMPCSLERKQCHCVKIT